MRRTVQTAIIAVFLGAFMTPVAAAEDVEIHGDIFVLNFELYRNGSVNMSSVTIEDGQPTNFGEHDAQTPTHRLTVESRDGEEIYTQDLKIDFKVYPYGGDPYFVDKRHKYWRLPYNDDAKQIELRDLSADEAVFSIDLEDKFCSRDRQCPAFCEGKTIDTDCTCGNGACDDNENAETCEEDCTDRSAGGIVETGEMDDVGWEGVNIVVIITAVILLIVIAFLAVRAWREVEIE